MTTWREEAEAEIARLVADLPADATIAERKAALRPDNRPYKFVVTSWGRKSWQRAQREYLAKFGPKSDAEIPARHLSPLERLMARAGRANA